MRGVDFVEHHDVDLLSVLMLLRRTRLRRQDNRRCALRSSAGEASEKLLHTPTKQ